MVLRCALRARELRYQTFDAVFNHQMKHLEVRQKYSAARRIFNSLLGVSSGDETLRLMFDILLIKNLSGKCLRARAILLFEKIPYGLAQFC